MTLRRAMAVLSTITFVWCLPGMAVRATFGAHVAVDEPQYLLSATSLGDDLDLDIGDELSSERWRTYHEAPLPVQTEVLDDGRQVSPHDPLLPAVLAVPMRIGGWRAAKVVMALFGAALAASMLWVAVRRLGIDLLPAVIGTAAFSLSAPLTVYATQVYPELPAALVVMLGIGAVLGPLTPRSAIAVGLAVTALPWLSVKYVPVGAALAMCALWRLHRTGADALAVRLLGGLALSGAVFAAVHLAVYEGLTPYAAGDHFVGGELDVIGTQVDYVGRSRRLIGLLVDRNFGIAAWQPAWLLAVPALAALVRRRPPWWATVVLPLLAGWLSASFIALTMHGFWWPGRQLVVVLPLIALAITWWASTLVGRGRAVLAAALATGAVSWWWLIAEGLDGKITWVFGFWRTSSPVHLAMRWALPDNRAPDDLVLTGWVLAAMTAALVAWRSAAAHEDAAAGEGADADHALADAHGDRAVR